MANGASLLLGLGVLTLVAGGLGLALALAARRWPADTESLPARINALLPQTQCAQCGYPGCRPYAEAIADGRAEINRCPPGGDSTTRQLAELLGREALPLAEDLAPAQPLLAQIDEARCIGCALCLPACPVDAIVGAHGFMHTVLARDCTGCELCVAPCPVDCIAMVTVDTVPVQLKRRPLPVQAA